VEWKKVGIIVWILLIIVVVFLLQLQQMKTNETVNQLKKDSTQSECFCKEFSFSTKQVFLITAYVSIDTVENRLSGLNVLGNKAVPWKTCAVDPNVILLGSWVWVEGYGWFLAEDTGNLVKGQMIDLCVETKEQAKEIGIRFAKVVVMYKEK